MKICARQVLDEAVPVAAPALRAVVHGNRFIARVGEPLAPLKRRCRPLLPDAGHPILVDCVEAMDRRDRLQPLTAARGCNPTIEKSILVRVGGGGEQQDCEHVSNHDLVHQPTSGETRFIRRWTQTHADGQLLSAYICVICGFVPPVRTLRVNVRSFPARICRRGPVSYLERVAEFDWRLDLRQSLTHLAQAAK
jgi:hypothetical protein